MIPARAVGAAEAPLDVRPAVFGDLLLLEDRLRPAALSTMAACPGIFARLLAVHVGEPIWSLA